MTVTTPSAYTPVTQTQTALLKAGEFLDLWVSLPSPGIYAKGTVVPPTAAPATSSTAAPTMKSPVVKVSSRTLQADLQMFDGAGVMIHTQPVTIRDDLSGQWVNKHIKVDPSSTDVMIPRIEATGGTGRWQVVVRCGDVVIGCGDLQTVGAGGGPNWAVPKPCVGCGS